MILVLDSDEVIGECVISDLEKNGFLTHLARNAIDAINYIIDMVPDLVVLDPILTGPDGFTFLNELFSYADTMDVPVVLISEKNFSGFDLSEYNIAGVLDKNKMKPKEFLDYARKYAKRS